MLTSDRSDPPLFSYAADDNKQLSLLQPVDADSGEMGYIWTVGLALSGYLWQTSCKGRLSCGTVAWTCPACDFKSDAYGGYGVAEDPVFVFENQPPIEKPARKAPSAKRIHRSRKYLARRRCRTESLKSKQRLL